MPVSTLQPNDDPVISHLLAANKTAHARMDDSVTRLIRLSRQIREHQKHKTDAMAAVYEPVDDNDQSLINAFQAYLDWILDESEQKLPKGFVKDRVRDTMLLRWRKLSYYSAGRGTAPILFASGPESQKVHAIHPSRVLSPVAGSVMPTAMVVTEPADSIAPELTVARSHGLTLSTSFRPYEQPESIAHSKNTRSLMGIQAFQIPNPPESKPGSQGFICPYCRELQPQTMREQTSWQLV